MTRYTKEDLATVVVDLDGKEVAFAINGVPAKMTVRLAFRRALNGNYADEEANPSIPGSKATITAEDRFRRYDLSKKIWLADDEVTLTTEEQSELKKCVSKAYGGEALGFLKDMLEKIPTNGLTLEKPNKSTGRAGKAKA